MRKILSFVLLIILSFTIISCGGDSDKESTNDFNTIVPGDIPIDTPPKTEPIVETPAVNIEFNKKVNMSYEFVGDEKDKPGFAQGYIHIDPIEKGKKNGYYVVFLASNSEILNCYDEFGWVKMTGEAVSIYIKDGRYLPYEARKLAVFESSNPYLKNVPDISKAVDIIDLPKSKRLDLGDSNFTMAATSDVHINYETLNFGSKKKWVDLLDFFGKKNANYLIVTGDMTGDTNLDEEYQYYIDSIKNSDIPLENVYEAIGNHGNTPTQIEYFTKYTSGSDEIHPFKGSAYYHVVVENNVFIFMAQELNGPSDSAVYDNFSKTQIDWLEGLLGQYGNTDKNVFITIHSPFLNFGPGDRHNGTYTKMITFKETYPQTMRLKGLLQKYKDAIVLSGHTHLTYYEGENYSNENDSFARMIHVSSGTQTSSYNYGDKMISDTDGRTNNSPYYGSEGYLIEIFDDYILFTGYNISTGKIIPAGHILLPTKAYGGTYIEPGSGVEVEENINFYDVVKGSGTLNDPYLISNETDFYAFTKEFEKSITKTETEMFGYGKYFVQVADLDMTKISNYYGTNAFGSARYTFAGTYNGGGHTIKVDINSDGNRSIFPYVYGGILNLKIEGSIIGGTCAQPVRSLYGHIANCIFDLKLTAQQTAGIVYSNYGSVYNVYVGGTLSGNPSSPVYVNSSTTNLNNIYHNTNSSSDYATKITDLNSVVVYLNSRNHPQYLEIKSKYNVEFLDFTIINDKIYFA